MFDTGMPTASMDRLVSTDCFAHAHGDTDSIMKEAARVLKRGTLMVFTTLMQPDTADASALAKVCQRLGPQVHRIKYRHGCLKPYYLT